MAEIQAVAAAPVILTDLPSVNFYLPSYMGDKHRPWICCQLGAREHYAIPRALLAAGRPCCLLTDAWVKQGSLLGQLKRNLRERYQPDLANVLVNAWNARSIVFELAARARRLSGWPLIRARNRWFQRQAVRQLRDPGTTDHGPRRRGQILFAYSYAALDIFRFARQQGWRTVLGQIDPGRPEERIVARLYEENPSQRGQWQPAPPQYWADWYEECRLADRIVVNSKWSQRALIEEGIPEEKIRIVPLAYEITRAVVNGQKAARRYPDRFTADRPLRVLFLGQINLRKGVSPLMHAARLLRDRPVEFWTVGPVQIDVPADLRDSPKVVWKGPVARGAAADFYRDADVFLFPTFSDGFGLTQLEAQAWNLPVIASKFCGEVVEDGHNGIVLPEVSASAIVDALERCLTAPSCLKEFARNAVPPERFGLKRIGEELLGIFD